MIAASGDYAVRIAGAGGINLSAESLAFKISRKELQELSQSDEFDGFVAALGVAPDQNGDLHQTFFMIPVDKNGKAIVLNPAAGMQGGQGWDPLPNSAMSNMINPDGSANLTNIQNFYDTIG